jgi:hypothetical protein
VRIVNRCRYGIPAGILRQCGPSRASASFGGRNPRGASGPTISVTGSLGYIKSDLENCAVRTTTARLTVSISSRSRANRCRLGGLRFLIAVRGAPIRVQGMTAPAVKKKAPVKGDG